MNAIMIIYKAISLGKRARSEKTWRSISPGVGPLRGRCVFSAISVESCADIGPDFGVARFQEPPVCPAHALLACARDDYRLAVEAAAIPGPHSAMLPIPIRGSTTENLAAHHAKRAACRKANSSPTSIPRRLRLWPRTRVQRHAGLDQTNHQNNTP